MKSLQMEADVLASNHEARTEKEKCFTIFPASISQWAVIFSKLQQQSKIIFIKEWFCIQVIEIQDGCCYWHCQNSNWNLSGSGRSQHWQLDFSAALQVVRYTFCHLLGSGADQPILRRSSAMRNSEHHFLLLFHCSHWKRFMTMHSLV